MKHKIKYINILFVIIISLFACNSIYAQYPGGVSTGTTRGYKVDYYNGTFTDQTGFGAGTANATPVNTAYSNKITGTEFFPIRQDNYGLEYTGILAITTAGNYTFNVTGDDRAWLYIDEMLVAQAKYNTGTATASINLTAGDHTIKVKMYDLTSSNYATVKFGVNPAGITVGDDVDGRFVRSENSKLTAWYKASDVTITPNFAGSGMDKVHSFVNKAPDYAGTGNLAYTGTYVSPGGVTQKALMSNYSMVNFNPAVNFDGDDDFKSGSTMRGLSLRGATKSMFLVNNYFTNIAQSGTWMFFHGDLGNNQRIGLYKNSAASNQLGVIGAGVSDTSPYTADEPKLLGGFVDQLTGGTAPNGTNPFSLRSNGSVGTTAPVFSNADYDSNGLYIANMNGTNFPEAIYYPFVLDQIQERKVNTYLAIKYGITLAHDYINPAGTVVFDVLGATNTGYKNRIFGIGRDMTSEGLNQKQSQSQNVAPAATSVYDFLVVSKGSVATTNTANTGTLADGDYLLMGDNGGSFTGQTTEVSPTLTTSCNLLRLGREWKVQTTGNPGSVTIQAGNARAGSFKFSTNFSGIVLIVDTDNDGDFSNATTVYHPSSLVNGAVTFENVPLVNGNVITFGWTFISPGGVSQGLKLWTKADDSSLPAGGVPTWNDLSIYANHLTGGTPAFVRKSENIFNYNPSVLFSGDGLQGLTSTTTLGISGDNTYSEFYILKATGVSGTAYNEFITLGDTYADHRWENNGTSFGSFNYGVYGNGTAQSSSSLSASKLGLYSNIANGTNAILSNNGVSVFSNATSAGLSTLGNFRIGTDVYQDGEGGFDWNSFYAPELIVYNTTLAGTDLQKVNSYLGIKYSIPLANGSGTAASNYLASDGTIIWTGNAVYKNGMFGIGRDDCSGLVQKQSKVYTEGVGTDNVKFGLTKLAATNAANTGSFTTDKQFIIIGHDGGALTGTTGNIPLNYLSSGCLANRYVRNWKVQNTNNTTSPLQIIIGDDSNKIPSNWNNVKLAINSAGDATFATGTTTLVAATSIVAGVATFDNVTLPNGVVFTVCSTLGFPGGVVKPTTGTLISGATYTNGLAYKLFSTSGPLTRDLITAPLPTGTDALLGNGYISEIETIRTIIMPKIDGDYGYELTGKILAPRTGTYTFRATSTDDQLAVIVNGVTTLNVTRYNSGVTYSSGAVPGANTGASTTVSLTAGQYYDITVRGGANGVSGTFNLMWDGVTVGAFTLIPNANLFVQPQGPSAWYMADGNSFGSLGEGSNLSTGAIWDDSSGNNNNITGTGPTYYATTPASIRNYNPTLYFNSNYLYKNGYLNGFAYGHTGKSFFAVSSNRSGSVETIYSGFGYNANNSNFGLTKLSSNKLTLFTNSNNSDEITAFYSNSVRTTDIISAVLSPIGNGTPYIYANGVLRASTPLTLPNFYRTRFGSVDQLQVGSTPGYTGVNYTGNLNEVIHYPWDLSTTERQQVNSYLAIKWGTTLDQTVATDYLASDGTKIWNSALNTSFKYDITGIGRDDCGNLNQKQSTSTDEADIVSIGLGGIEVNNNTNATSFAQDKSFLTWSNNNAALSFSSTVTTNLPAVLITTGCYERFSRVWQAQVTGTVGPLTVAMGKVGLVSVNASLFKPVLLVGNDPNDFTNATVYHTSKSINGTAYFDNVALTNGQYFALSFIQAAPGGVKQNMTTWFNADYDVFTDVAQTTNATVDGDVVRSINNLKAGAAFGSVNEVSSAYNPVYKPGSFNYNTGVLFDGVNDVLASTSNISSTDFRTATTMTSVFAGQMASTTGQVFWAHNGTRKTTLERTKAYWNDDNSNPLNRTPGLTTPEIYSFANTSSGAGWRLYSNLKTVGSGTTGNLNLSLASGRFLIGNNSLVGTGSGANFYLGEFVIYSDDKGGNTTYDMRRIHSYMGMKYGFTLDQTAMGGQYIASNGLATYNHTTHWNRITGIGMDDCSAFEQRQSFSQDAGALVKVSHDPSGLAATNFANPVKFDTNLTFLVFGDNNGAVSWSDEDAITLNSENYVRLGRTWRTKETGTVGAVYIEVPDNSSLLATKLPTENNSVYLMVSNTNDFTTPTAFVEMVLTGTNWSTNYNFTDGDYFTFATKTLCLAPGGVTNGLTTWYKMSSQSLGGADNLTDNSPSGSTTLSKVGTAAVITSGTSTMFNFNRYLPVTGSVYYESGALNETSVYSVNAGTTFGVGNGTSKDLFGFGRTTLPYNRTGLAANSAYFNDAINNYPASTNIPNILVANTAIGGTATTKNHTTWNNGVLGSSVSLTANDLPVASNYKLRFASMTPVTTGNLATYGLAEAFTYNRSLSTVEVQKVNTYLAIKYGQTLAHNYFTTGYDGTNAATETLYDVSTYGNRVFGIGHHIAGCLTQNKSTSMVTGSLLKIGVEGDFLTENSQDVSPWGQEDRVYTVIGDNNGALAWVNTSKPALLATNACANRVTRQWKVTTTKQSPVVFFTIPDNTSTAATKLDAIPANNSVYMIINNTDDFTVNGSQSEISMTLNSTTKEWEASATLDPNVTKYITFVYRPATCGKTCIITNQNTKTTKL